MNRVVPTTIRAFRERFWNDERSLVCRFGRCRRRHRRLRTRDESKRMVSVSVFVVACFFVVVVFVWIAFFLW